MWGFPADTCMVSGPDLDPMTALYGTENVGSPGAFLLGVVGVLYLLDRVAFP